MKLKKIVRQVMAGTMACMAFGAAQAEISEVTIAKQYGVSYLPFMLMERDKLIEKYARASGLEELRVNWRTFAGGGVMNDA
jgi:NitT/TauT family transport system substrate-binding protein